jgi:hypothetical protein
LFNYVLYRGSATQVRIWWYYPAPLSLLEDLRLQVRKYRTPLKQCRPQNCWIK